MRDLFIRFLANPMPLRLALGRRIVKQLSLFSYEDRLTIGAVDRAHYGYCIFQAAKLASLLNYPRMSVIEFGCGGGNGLINAEMHIKEVMKLCSVDIELYGFDAGSGLPSPVDYRDMPTTFEPVCMKWTELPYQRQLERAKLGIGDVRDTCRTFLQEHEPATIGCVLDYYSSTRNALTLIDGDSRYFFAWSFYVLR